MLDEALHLLDAGVDSLELQFAAELRVAPALEHFGDHLSFGVQGPDRVNEICTSDVVDCHPKLLPCLVSSQRPQVSVSLERPRA